MTQRSLDDPIDDLPSYNREHARKVVDCITEGRFCAVLGPAFFGKTRVLEAVQKRFADNSLYALALIDLRGVKQGPAESLWSALARKIQKSPRCRSARVQARTCTSSSEFRSFLRELAMALRCRLVLMLDHLEDIPRDTLIALLKSLRAANQEGVPLTAVICGVLSLVPDTVEPTSPFNVAVRVILGEMTEADNDEIIARELVTDVGDVPAAVRAEIRRQAGGDPTLIRTICGLAVDDMRSANLRTITPKLVARVAEAFTRGQAQQHRPLVEAARMVEANPILMECVVSYLLKRKRVRRDELPLATIDNLDPLYLTGLVRREGGLYVLRNEIYRVCLESRFGPERVGRLWMLFGRWKEAIEHLRHDEAHRPELVSVTVSWIYATDNKNDAARPILEGLIAAYGAESAAFYDVDAAGKALIRVDQAGKHLKGESPFRPRIRMDSDSVEAQALRSRGFASDKGAGVPNRFAFAITKPHPGDGRSDPELALGVVVVLRRAAHGQQDWSRQVREFLRLAGQALDRVASRDEQFNDRLKLREVLHTIAGVSAEADDERAAAQRILQAIRRVLPFDRASIQLLTAREDAIKIVFHVGFPHPERVDAIPEFALNDDHFPNVEVFRTRRTRRSGDCQNDFPHFRDPVFQITDMKSWMGAPLITGNAPIGVITLDSLKPAAYTDDDEDLLEAFASQAAQTIQAVRRMNDAKQRARAMETYARVIEEISGNIHERSHVLAAEVRGVCEIVSATSAVIYPFRPGTEDIDYSDVAHFGLKAREEFERRGSMPSNRSLTHLISRGKGRTVVSNVDGDAREAVRKSRFIEREGIKAFVGVALRVSGARPLGVMFVNFDHPHDFTEEELEHIRRFSAFAAVAILKVRSYEILADRSTTAGDMTRYLAQVVNHGHKIYQRAFDLQQYAQALGRVAKGLEAGASREALAQAASAIESVALDLHQWSPQPALEAPQAVAVDREVEAFVREALQPYDGVEVKLDLRAQASVRITPSLLRIALEKVTTNSLESMKKRGRLTFATRVEDATVIISVVDTGPGMPSDLRPRFGHEPVKRSDRQGMGAFVARSILLQAGGDLICADRTPGCEVRLALPVSAA